jgi:hypothetical protein
MLSFSVYAPVGFVLAVSESFHKTNTSRCVIVLSKLESAASACQGRKSGILGGVLPVTGH